MASPSLPRVTDAPVRMAAQAADEPIIAQRRQGKEIVGWDIGERPTVPMAHFRYPIIQPDTLMRRSGLHCVTEREQQQKQRERERRLRAVAETGWASPRSGVYHALGELQDLPVDGSQLRRAPPPWMQVAKPVAVQPARAFVDTSNVPSEEARAILLERPAKGFVAKFKSRYFSVTLEYALPLRLTLRCISGDPDMYVSNETTHPTVDDHVWGSSESGTDEIVISTEDACFTLGTYYVGVTAMTDSEFELRAEQVACLRIGAGARVWRRSPDVSPRFELGV